MFDFSSAFNMLLPKKDKNSISNCDVIIKRNDGSTIEFSQYEITGLTFSNGKAEIKLEIDFNNIEIIKNDDNQENNDDDELVYDR